MNLQNLSYISEIVIALASVVALKQIVLAKRDIKIRSKREAITLSVNQVEYYRSEIIKEIIILENILGVLMNNDNMKEELVFFKSNKVDLEDFTFQEIEEKNMLENWKRKMNFLTNNKSVYIKVQDISNKIEYFSLAFVSGAAEEEVAFNPVVDSFLDFIKKNYNFYCLFRKENNRSYSNTITLYKIWKKKILEQDIKTKIKSFNKDIDEVKNKIKKINQENIEVIGTN